MKSSSTVKLRFRRESRRTSPIEYDVLAVFATQRRALQACQIVVVAQGYYCGNESCFSSLNPPQLISLNHGAYGEIIFSWQGEAFALQTTPYISLSGLYLLLLSNSTTPLPEDSIISRSAMLGIPVAWTNALLVVVVFTDGMSLEISVGGSALENLFIAITFFCMRSTSGMSMRISTWCDVRSGLK